MSPGFDFKALSALQLSLKGKGDEASLELQKLSSKSVSKDASNIYLSPPMKETSTTSQLLNRDDHFSKVVHLASNA